MPGASYRFGPFVADRIRYQVLEGIRPVALTPKLLDLLFHLLDHAGDLVTREALLDELWPGANVTDNALAQAVSELRDALGDEPSDPRYIKTIARRGYRFIGEVGRIDATEGPAKAGHYNDDARPAKAGEGPAKAGHYADGATIAVLDFTNVTGDADAAWLSAGIAETVTNDLRALERFRVIDRWRVVEAARRTDGSLSQIAADLGARLAVVGSVQQIMGRVRITARVVDLGTGEARADAKVDGPVDQIFALQDDVVRQLAVELGVAGAPAGAKAASRSRETTSLEAHRAFSAGWLHLESLDVRETPRAAAEFERAVAADPAYALAYTGLATAEFAQFESTRCANEPAQEQLVRAIEHAREAIRLDPNLAEAHATLALVLTGAWRSVEAAAAARRAVAIEPSNWRHLFRLGHATWGNERLGAASSTLELYPDFAFSHFQTAMVHVARGRLRDAETVLRQGAAVQDRQSSRGGRYPALGLHWLLGLVRLAENDPAEAIEEFDRESRLAEPHRLYGREYAAYARIGRGAALIRSNRSRDAVRGFTDALEFLPHHGPAWIGLALAHQQAGEPGAADAALEEASNAVEVLTRTRPIEAAIVRAQLSVARGEPDQAAGMLETLLTEAPAGFAGWTIPVEPFLAEVSADQRFTGVLKALAVRAD